MDDMGRRWNFFLSLSGRVDGLSGVGEGFRAGMLI